MKIKLACLLLFWLVLSINCFSQKKNSVKIYSQGLNFISKEVASPNLGNNGFENLELNSISGISYERNIKGRFGIGGQFTMWWWWWGQPIQKHKFGRSSTRSYFTTHFQDTSSIGKIVSGNYFKTYEVYGTYTLNLRENLPLTFKIGPSVTHGENTYIKDAFPYPTELPHFMVFVETKKETYFGAFTSASLSYNLWKGRIPVGIDLVGRYYHNFPFQLNYGLHTGFNF